MKKIELSEELLAKAVKLGEDKVAINKKEKMAHQHYYTERMKKEGNHELFWAMRGTIGEAAVFQYLSGISTHFDLPQPEWTGGYAWTPAERRANWATPDLTWLGIEIESKVMESYWGGVGVNWKDAQAGRTQIVAVPELLKWDDYYNNDNTWTNVVHLRCAVELGQFAHVDPATGFCAWNDLEITNYEKTGIKCRRIQQKHFVDVSDWARSVVLPLLPVEVA